MSAFLEASRRKSRRGVVLHKRRAGAGLHLVTEPAERDALVRTRDSVITTESWLQLEVQRMTVKGAHCAIVNVGSRIAIARTR